MPTSYDPPQKQNTNTPQRPINTVIEEVKQNLKAYEFAEEELEEAPKETFGDILYNQFVEWKNARITQEDQWSKNISAYNSVYYNSVYNSTYSSSSENAAKIQKEGNNSCGKYVGITRFKCTSAISKIYSLLFPGATKKNWSIEPTPVPELYGNTMQEFIKTLPPELLKDMQNQDPELIRKAVKMFQEKKAEDTVKGMTKEIDDQLTEANYPAITRKAVRELVILGTGAAKKANIQVRRKQKWEKKPDERTGKEVWVVEVEEKIDPNLGSALVWNLYPDPEAPSLDSCRGIYERHSMTKAALRELKEVKGFDGAVVEEILSHYISGNYQKEWWETRIDIVAGNRQNKTDTISHRYEVVSFWGYVDGEKLAEAGVKIGPEDYGMQFQANVWLCGNKVIMARLNPLDPVYLPYVIVPFEEVTNQIWGTGLPEKIEQTQALINDVVRAMMNNLSISSGPQVEVNVDLIPEEMRPAVMAMKTVEAWKIWFRSGTGDGTAPLLRFYYPPSITSELLAVVEMLRRMIDEESNIPAIMQGESMWKGGDMTKTASGMSMLLNEATQVTMGIITNFDDYFIRPIIRSLYDFNMKWSEDDEIKGDMKVRALGVASYRKVEVYTRKLMQFLQLTADDPIAKRREILTEIAESLDLPANKMLNTEEEMEGKKNPLMDAKIKLEIELLTEEVNQAKAGVEKTMAEVQKILNEAQIPPESKTQPVESPPVDPFDSEIKVAEVGLKDAQTKLTDAKTETEEANRVIATKKADHEIRKEQIELMEKIESGVKEGKKPAEEPAEKTEKVVREPKPQPVNVNVDVNIEGKKARLAVRDEKGDIIGARDAEEGELEAKKEETQQKGIDEK